MLSESARISFGTRMPRKTEKLREKQTLKDRMGALLACKHTSFCCRREELMPEFPHKNMMLRKGGRGKPNVRSRCLCGPVCEQGQRGRVREQESAKAIVRMAEEG